MEIHNSSYERDGWIPLATRKPEPRKLVMFAQIHIMDWNLESFNWQTDGHMLNSGAYSLKMRDGINTQSGNPTHWKERQ